MLMCPKQFVYIITVSSTVQKDSGEGGGGGAGRDGDWGFLQYNKSVLSGSQN